MVLLRQPVGPFASPLREMGIRMEREEPGEEGHQGG